MSSFWKNLRNYFINCWKNGDGCENIFNDKVPKPNFVVEVPMYKDNWDVKMYIKIYESALTSWALSWLLNACTMYRIVYVPCILCTVLYCVLFKTQYVPKPISGATSNINSVFGGFYDSSAI